MRASWETADPVFTENPLLDFTNRVYVTVVRFLPAPPRWCILSIIHFVMKFSHIMLIVLVSAVISGTTAFGVVYLTARYGEALPLEIPQGFIRPRVSESEQAPTTQPPLPQGSYEERLVGVVERAQRAVVSIVATKDLPIIERRFVDPFEGFRDPFFNEFFGPFQFRIPQYQERGTQKQEVSGGTGFVVSADGLIITNRHVVDVSGAEYTVILNDGERLSAEVLARDPVEDLAIVKIEKTGLPTLSLGDSDALKIGQIAIAIGNALGEFRNTVSVGVISGLDRRLTIGDGGIQDTIENAIQTDAAINRGNSGGPLLNLQGEVVGINTAIVIGSQNIGFAIPANKAKKALTDVEKYGRITYPFLGVRYIIVTDDLKERNNLSVNYGALILRGEERGDLAVMPGSPADKAGLQENDIILEVNGQKITEENSLVSLIKQFSVGETVTLKVLSRGEEKTVRATLVERP